MRLIIDILKFSNIFFHNTGQTDIIDIFGIHGNGIDKITLYTSHSGNVINILCGSSLPGVDINWLLPNGTKVGISDRDILEGYIANGTSALQFRRITLCISDLYICRANQTVTGMVQQRTLKVKVNSKFLTMLIVAKAFCISMSHLVY